MGTNPEVTRHYPKKIELDENYLRLKPGAHPHTHQIPLRLMGAEDKAKILKFADGLSEEDLLFFAQRYQRSRDG